MIGMADTLHELVEKQIIALSEHDVEHPLRQKLVLILSSGKGEACA